MPEPIDPPSPAALPHAALLAAWLGQSHDLLALTDSAGAISWCNPAFERATGLVVAGDLMSLAPAGAMHDNARAALGAALRDARFSQGDKELALRTASGTLMWARARVVPVGGDLLWTLFDSTAQHQLAARAQHLSELLDMAQEFGRLGVWEREVASGAGRWDRHVFGFWGIAPEGGTPDYSVAASRLHEEDRTPYYLESLRQAGRYAERYRVLRPDGSMRRIHAQWEVKSSALGTPDRVIGIMVDDTEVYELARSRDEAAAQLKLATELADIAIWRHDLKTERIQYNEHGLMVLGLPRRAGGLSLAEARSHTHPDDRQKLADSSAQALATGVPVDVEVRHRRSDGAWRQVLVRRVIERDAAGDVIAFVGVTLDVTERHAALGALHAASTRAALIARHAGIGTWETGEPGQPALWDEQMWLLRGLEPRPVSLDRDERLALAHPDDRAHVLDANPDNINIPGATSYEFRVRMPDGGYRWLASRSATLLDERGKVARRVGVNWDITEAKNADLARAKALLAERESQAKSQFLSRMSHELRTPLNAVLGFTQLLQIEAQHEPESTRALHLEHIRAAGEHLLTLIDDALDLSSLHVGMLRLEIQPVPLALAVAQALPLVGALAASHGVSLHRGALSGTARADPTRLRQVLLNLLTNAIKYNRAGGQVTVDAGACTDEQGDQVRLRVTDNGRGMTPEQLGQLFEPFNRLGMEGADIAGSGIGLTIARALVDGMGGRIDASSEAGRGTVFEVTLPLADSATPAGSAPLLPVATRLERSGQLLYIEDNAVNVLLVEELVKNLSGLRMVSEPTGAAGVARARAIRPDLILIDMQLPDFDGFEVLRQLRADAGTAQIPCIALSANAMPDDAGRALSAGFDAYWTKPIRFKPFLDALERLFPPIDKA